MRAFGLIPILVGLMLLGDSLLAAQNQPNLQHLLDQASAGQKLQPPAGRYVGNFIIDKPLVLDGQNKVVLDGGGQGTVITLKADGVTLTNLEITNSGDSHDQINAAVAVLSNHNKIQHNHIHDTLFGVELREAHDNHISHNDISSKPVDLGLRGDGVKVWASHRNVFRHNRIHDSRDMVIWYSEDTVVEYNEGWNNRYSLHFMYAGQAEVRHNRYRNSAVGIFQMYSKNAIVEYNDIRYSIGPTGMGIGMKEVDNMQIQFNTVVYCSTGLYLDQSPFDPYSFNVFKGNKIAYNTQGVVFHSTWKQNVFKGNQFIDNLEPVQVRSNGTAIHNIWQGNYWSQFEGFDRDHDGYGDRKHSQLMHLDQIWMNQPWLRFFLGTPVMSVVNFISRLMPLSSPKLILEDEKPVFNPDVQVLHSAQNLFFDVPDEDEMDEDW